MGTEWREWRAVAFAMGFASRSCELSRNGVPRPNRDVGVAFICCRVRLRGCFQGSVAWCGWTGSDGGPLAYMCLCVHLLVSGRVSSRACRGCVEVTVKCRFGIISQSTLIRTKAMPSRLLTSPHLFWIVVDSPLV